MDRICLINLDRRPDRLERFSQAHPELVGRFERISAYDGKALELTPSLARLFAPNNFDWHKATMGCAMSHLSLWQRLSETPGENWLILEDDARLLPGWESAVERAMEPGALPSDWEILFLGGILPKYRDLFEENVLSLPGGIGRVKPECVFGKNPAGYFHFCAYAYLLSHRGARRVLDLVKSGNGVWMQADFLLAYTTADLSPPRPVYFLHPLVAESFQDREEGFAKPYGEDDSEAERVDSDIWKEQDRFPEEHVAALKNDSLPLDIPGALQDQKPNNMQVNMNLPGVGQIWVINLERRPDRLARFKANHAEVAEQIQVLKAFDGKKLRLTPKIARLFAPNEFHWNKALIGCTLSHLELWHRLSKETDENAQYLIFEDYTKLNAGWLGMVKQAFAHGDVPQNWDVLYLGGILPKNQQCFAQCKEQVSGRISRIVPNGWFGQNPQNRYFHFCANAYLLSKNGAKKLLEFIRLQNGIWPQSDMLLAYETPATYPVKIIHYFFDPLLADCYQDVEAGFRNPYDETQKNGELDSDIQEQDSNFDKNIAEGLFSMSEPYDIEGAIQESRFQMDEGIDEGSRSNALSLQSKGHFELLRPSEVLDDKNSNALDKEAIALCADKSFFAYTSVVILSLVKNGKCGDIPIYVFAEEFEEADIQKFHELSEVCGGRITLVPLGNHALQDLPSFAHMSRATYLRLLIPSILQEIPKILYLDSDLLILSDLRELFETDLSSHPVAAVRDLIGEKCCKIDVFKTGEEHYFNAGVLLINTKEWKHREISEKVIEIARDDAERQRLSSFADQCLLNYIICGDFLELDKKFNLPTFEPRNCSQAFLQLAPTPCGDELKRAKILHFTGHCKPWMPDSSLEEIWGLYKRFADLSPWIAAFDTKNNFKVPNIARKCDKQMTKRSVIRFCISHEPPLLPESWFDEVIKLGDYGRGSETHIFQLSSFWDESRNLSYGAAGSYCIPYAVKKLKVLPEFIEINSFRKKVLSKEIGKLSPNYPGMREIALADACQIDVEGANFKNLASSNFLVCQPHNFCNGYLEQYASVHHRVDFLDYAQLAVEMGVISKDDFQIFIECKTFIPGGCEFGIYPCKWLLGILSKFEELGRHFILKHKDRILSYDAYQVRCIGFLSERLGSFLLLKELNRRFNNQIPATVFGHMTTIVPDEKSNYKPASTRRASKKNLLNQEEIIQSKNSKIIKKAALFCVTQNNAIQLQNTLNSVISNTKAELLDLFIIDNASIDQTLKMYHQKIPHHFTIVRSARVLQYIEGIKLGFKLTKGYELVGLISDDVVFCSNWLENVIDVFDCNLDVAAAGPILSNNSTWQSYDNIKDRFNLPSLSEIDRNNVTAMYDHVKTNGSGMRVDQMLNPCCLFLRGSTFENFQIDNHSDISKIDEAVFIENIYTYIKHQSMQLAVSLRTYIGNQ